MYGANAYGQTSYGDSIGEPDSPSKGKFSYASSVYGRATYGGSVTTHVVATSYQPDVVLEATATVDWNIVFQPNVSLDATAFIEWAVSHHPVVSLEASATVVWDNAYSEQPSVSLSGRAIASVDPPVLFIDTFGFADIEFVSSAALDIETEPVPMPEHLISKPTERVSIIMPVPDGFDEFGRPQ